MEEYRYCLVRPKDMEKSYSYLSDEDLSPGACVVVPLGYENYLHKGIVEAVEFYTKDTAPWPVEKTKWIFRTMTREEYDAEETPAWYRYAHTFPEDLDDLDDYMVSEDYDAMFDWADEHDGWTDFPDVMETVVRCYRVCADHGHPKAALYLGNMYYNGSVIGRDYREAARLYEIAAAAGEVRALCNLGYCWYYGRHAPADYAKAYHYYHLGALLYDDPNCLYKLGDMYRDGKFVPANREYTARLYFRALEACTREDAADFCRPDILMRVGRVMMESATGSEDVKRALDCFFQALSGFYERRKGDPFVSGLIADAKRAIREAEALLDREVHPGYADSDDSGTSDSGKSDERDRSGDGGQPGGVL